MSNTANKTTGWTFQHETAVDASGCHHNVTPTDARGLRLRLESGYLWLNKNDGSGWIQTAVELKRAEIRESVNAAVEGYKLGTVQDADGRREAKLDALRGRRRVRR